MKIKLYIIFLFILSFQFLNAQSGFNTDQISNKKSIATEISIFPNPATNYFKISSSAPIAKVEIYNLIGKKIKIIKNNNSNSFDISSFRNGIYLVRIFDSNQKVLKVVRIGINNTNP